MLFGNLSFSRFQKRKTYATVCPPYDFLRIKERLGQRPYTNSAHREAECRATEAGLSVLFRRSRTKQADTQRLLHIIPEDESIAEQNVFPERAVEKILHEHSQNASGRRSPSVLPVQKTFFAPEKNFARPFRQQISRTAEMQPEASFLSPDASHGRHQTPASGAHRFQKCSFRRNHVRERSLCRPQQDQARKVADCSLRGPDIPPLEKRCPPSQDRAASDRLQIARRFPARHHASSRDAGFREKHSSAARSARKQKRRPQKTSVEKLLSKFFSLERSFKRRRAA